MEITTMIEKNNFKNLNIKNTKKVKIRSKLQTITETFEEYDYDMESINDEWLIHFRKDDIKFVLEISSVDNTINNFKLFINDKWEMHSEENFDKIINISREKINNLYGEKIY